LVEFTIDEGISDDEAVALIESPPQAKQENNSNISDLVQTLQLDDSNEDPFTSKFILSYQVSV